MLIRLALAVAALAVGLIVLFPAARADDDDTTAQFIATCSVDPHSCQGSIGVGVVMGLSGPCVPQSLALASDAQILQVVDWLKAHPDVHPDDWADAVDAALEALYPCAN
ncbi:MAG TPA: hypothetical protein VLT91_10130 [Rhizomicrobium sp.]|nr:hypothetical protein [Rhizomicrobium sp.]